jgi:hypothetical protein
VFSGAGNDRANAHLTRGRWRSVLGRLTPTAAFAALISALVAAMAADFRPPPVYQVFDPHPDRPEQAVLRDGPVALVLDLRGPMPTGLTLPVIVPSAGLPLAIRLRDPQSGRLIAQRTVTRTGTADLDLTGIPAPFGRLRLELESQASTPDRAPRVRWSKRGPQVPYSSTIAGQPEDSGPLLRLHYPWPSRRWLWLWPLAGVAFILAAAREDWTPVFIVAVSLCAGATSVLLWQQDYSWRHPHSDPDRYGLATRVLADALTRPETRADAAAFFRSYPHAHTALGPGLLSLPVALGAPLPEAYLVASALCGFASVALFFRLLRRRLEVPHPFALVGLAIFSCHLLMLRSFARPITDVFGLLLVLLLLDLILARLASVTLRDDVILSALLLAHTLARPQGIGYVPWFAAAAVFADARREGRLDPTRAFHTLARLLVGPLFVLAALFATFGWAHNVGLMLRKAAVFREDYAPGRFVASLTGTLQLFPLTWAAAGRSLVDWRIGLLASWACWAVGLLVAAQAPFWMRHFLPLLPAVAGLSAVAIAGAPPRLRSGLVALALLACAGNIAAVIHQIDARGEIAQPWRHLISPD